MEPTNAKLSSVVDRLHDYFQEAIADRTLVLQPTVDFAITHVISNGAGIGC